MIKMTIDCSKINVKKGSSGDYTKEVQKYLKYYGYYDGNIDGSCGNYTVEAIKKWQKSKGLVVDGVFGQLSCKASSINGTDISNSSKVLPLATFKDMLQRYTNYVKTKGKEPNITYIDINNPYEYVTVKQFSDMNKRYQEWIAKNGKEPNTVAVNKSTTTTTTQTTTSTTNSNKTKFTVTTYCESNGGDCLGQITGYHCGPHSIKQALRKFGIKGYSERTIGSYAGTTTAGTGHGGLETAIATIARKEGITLKVTWKNFSDLGNTQRERFKKLGELMTASNTAVFWHELYRNKYGHYSLAKTDNLDNSSLIIANSLGSKCNSPAYCGYMETRSFSTQVSYFRGISQKSICIITKA